MILRLTSALESEDLSHSSNSTSVRTALSSSPVSQVSQDHAPSAVELRSPSKELKQIESGTAGASPDPTLLNAELKEPSTRRLSEFMTIPLTRSRDVPVSASPTLSRSTVAEEKRPESELVSAKPASNTIADIAETREALGRQIELRLSRQAIETRPSAAASVHSTQTLRGSGALF